ncbi:MAG: hypothetical protein LBL66_01715 [Clostridiales bacterium]|jgi:hypothetical protein|nr:hypothetical protein [Clostridiales bacterium]
MGLLLFKAGIQDGIRYGSPSCARGGKSMNAKRHKKFTGRPDNGSDRTMFIINEFYTGTKTLKEKLLNIMITKINDEGKGKRAV